MYDDYIEDLCRATDNQLQQQKAAELSTTLKKCSLIIKQAKLIAEKYSLALKSDQHQISLSTLSKDKVRFKKFHQRLSLTAKRHAHPEHYRIYRLALRELVAAETICANYFTKLQLHTVA